MVSDPRIQGSNSAFVEMKELATQQLDERLQKQVQQVRIALKKGGVEYAIQVCAHLLKGHPSAYEIRCLLWEALRANLPKKPGRLDRIKSKSAGIQFQISTRSLLKKDPILLIKRCDESLLKGQVFSEVFTALSQASEVLGWIETRVMACRAAVDLAPEKCSQRLDLARVLIEVKRPQEAIEQLETALALESANGEAQTLLKNASVAETLQRGKWEDTDSNFHSKKKNT